MITSLIEKFKKVCWILPGFLLWASFPPMGEKTDVLFALAPLIWLSRRADAKTSAKRWFLSGAVFWVATLSWMPAIVKNGGPWPLVVLGWFALAAYCAAYFAAYGWLSAAYWAWARRGDATDRRRMVWRFLGVLCVEPVLWCGLELVRSRLLGGFAWNQLGVVPANGGFGAPAAIGGVYLLSVIVFLINGTVAGIAERVWKPEACGFPLLKKFGPIETVLAFAMIWGVYQLDGGKPAPTSVRQVKVGLIQRNFPCVFKGREENPYETYGRLAENVAALRPDMIVLPESAMCEFGPVDQQGAVRFATWLSGQCGNASVLAGGTRYGDGREYNSAALYVARPATPGPFEGDRQPSMDLDLYDKVHLVPFGEYIPGDKIVTALQKLAPVGSCTPGELKLLSLPLQATNCAVGVAICFEDTDSAQMRRLAVMGAKALFFITNDSWFSHSHETVQHAWQATARALETGLPVVRVGNSGVTGSIAPDGKTSWLIGTNGKPLVDSRGTMLDRIAIADDETSGTTLYVRLGDVPLTIAFVLLIIGMILVKYRNNYEQRRTLSV